MSNGERVGRVADTSQDYGQLIEEARRHVVMLYEDRDGDLNLADLLSGLSAAVEVQGRRIEELEAERDSWKRLWERLDSTSEKHYENLIQDRMDVEAERDALRVLADGLQQQVWDEVNARLALRAALDSMTVEWGVEISVPHHRWVESMRNREECARWIANPPLRYTHQVGEEFSIVKRLAASPWTVVEEGK